MDRNAVTRGPRDLKCPVGHCSNKRTGEQVCCRRCWFLVPRQMREEIWKLYETAQGSVTHRKAILAAIAYLDAKEAKRQASIRLIQPSAEAPKEGTMQKDKCASCDAEIFWATTEKNGKAHPINYAPDPMGNVVIIAPADPREPLVASFDVGFRQNGPRYMTHFATCPDAKSWSKP